MPISSCVGVLFPSLQKGWGVLFPKTVILVVLAAVARCCPTHLHCSQQQHENISLWSLSIEFRQLFSVFCGRTDIFPALTSSYKREGKL